MSSTENLPLREADTVRRILETLPQLLPNLQVESVRRKVRAGPSAKADAVARVKAGNQTKELIFEVKASGEPRIAEQAIMQLRRLAHDRPGAYLVFAAPYISERTREICRSQGVGYLDLVGDAYLRYGSVLVDRVSTRGRPIEKRSLRTLFAPKATRVLRELLQSPKEPTTITKLAEACSMSPAGVYLVVSLLETKGFVKRGDDRSIVLEEPDRLLRTWAENWTVERNRVSRFFSFERGPEEIISRIAETAKRLGADYALTGMAGAALSAPFVRYGDVWFYAREGKDRLIEALDLRPVGSGANVVVLDAYDEGVFSGMREVRGVRVVSDIQLFVDLFKFPARGEEQAEEIFARAIKFPRAK
jgi:DNA-binding transcriptional ArsR family regulator